MIPEQRIPAHLGEILWEEFLKPMHVSQVAFARHIGAPVQKRGVTPETSWLFAQALGTTPGFWMNLQMMHDLARKRPQRQVAQLQPAAAGEAL
jgi:addiction module HigA family antidote